MSQHLRPLLLLALTSTLACTGNTSLDDGADGSDLIDGGDDAGEVDAAPPGPDYVALVALANGMYVSAAEAGALPLVASQPSIGDWERFEVIENPDGSIALRARANDRYVSADGANGGRLVASASSIGARESFRRAELGDGSFSLQLVADDQFVAADLDLDAVLHANRAAVGGAWEAFRFTPAPTQPSSTNPDFGPSVLVLDPSMSPASMQARLDEVFGQMESNHFGDERFAILFKPGRYDVDVNVGFYTQVAGLGFLPDDATITGELHAEADWFDGNATQNFWRGVENLGVEPAGGTMRWAVSQASPFRRLHVHGSLVLDDGGWSSGGFLADSLIDDTVISGSQQQWFSRNAEWGQWTGQNWNMVFTGVINAPSGNNWPNPPYTVTPKPPILREKPFLYVDADGAYGVFVPALRKDSEGTTWASQAPAGETLPITDFYIAHPGVSAAELNEQLDAGKNLLFVPGVFHVEDTIRVTRPDTVVLGLGLATLIPANGVITMSVADVDGVKIVGLLFDAGEVSSEVLLEVGPEGSSASHATNPTSLHDVFFRVGGAAVGRAEVSLAIHSNHVIGDHFWVWRADHTYGVAWDLNTTRNGMVVNGDDVTIYGLFVEHYHEYQTVWNGERGRVFFYQSEIPYDVPDQGSWSIGGRNGFASYKVADAVNNHEVWAMGIYCFFSHNPGVRLQSAVEVPDKPGVRIHRALTVSLGGQGEITHVVNDRGGAANGSSIISHLADYP